MSLVQGSYLNGKGPGDPQLLPLCDCESGARRTLLLLLPHFEKASCSEGLRHTPGGEQGPFYPLENRWENSNLSEKGRAFLAAAAPEVQYLRAAISSKFFVISSARTQ